MAKQAPAAPQQAFAPQQALQRKTHRAEAFPQQLTLEPCPVSSASPEQQLVTPPTPVPLTTEPQIEVRRSKRRRRTVSAYREGDRTIVLLPARMTRAEEKHWIDEMLARLEAQDRRARPSEKKLLARAQRLSTKYLRHKVSPASVKWVDNQKTRWGSCTIDDKSIRLSTRLQGMPEWVVDYVLLHELAHLIEPSHDERFWRLLDDYPLTERARGFLDGWSASCQTHGIDA
jgi:predicted metal-dependent hydrolase